MVLSDKGEQDEGSNECNGSKVKGRVPLTISTTRAEVISSEDPQSQSDGSISTVNSNRTRFLNFGSLESPSAKFQKYALVMDEISRKVPSSGSQNFRDRLHKVFGRKIDWNCLKKMCKEWIRNPMNMVLLVWIVCVAVSGAILFLVMTGMLNSALPRKSQRDAWFEVNNQILNALFTLMCLYQHPQRLYHLVLLLRWKPEDISRLRKIYCKNGTYKPHEWAHMMVVIILLNLNCFAQYALCGLNVGYKRSERPPIGVGITISVAIGAPAIAGIYCIVSPLGKDYDSEVDEEAQMQITAGGASRTNQLRSKSLERRFSFASRDEGNSEENRPQWSGGILDFWDDLSSAYLSLFCAFCVFGWNMERLGFGNMYVHIVTFLLFCLAPFWIFNLAAININNEIVRQTLGLFGIFLCIFGLLYGGFWRIQMRKRFNLPPNNSCCGKPAVADCASWLFCCWCTLAQEVRTGNFYDILEDKLCRKHLDKSIELPISPLPREDRDSHIRSATSSSIQITMAKSSSPTRFSEELVNPGRELHDREEAGTNGNPDMMTPPAPLLIQREHS
ncbi:Protein PLANT CADMIUM RESISTANCE like [Heracleum sosnowskyi]|uniref:Protein PLANT CADMIUM RESISTANCE like n=1 Tax=Heracleum sosnowskyi TaxID=360622 RepID=A0AAD8GVW8_9APIA|nr:Protein PLANT CADMIUM RESISTANCE like [Heracleum sosnowskyi]